MIRIFTILSVIIMIILAGCSSDASRKAASALAVAEEIMDERPDSALTLLSDSALIPSDRRQKALYALLLTQARHKNFIDETNDSLIATAVDYFDKHHDNPRLMKSLFYQATINYNDQSFQPAMAIAMRADKIAKDLNDIYWQARVSHLIGMIFSDTYCYEEAIKYYDIAASLFKDLNIEIAYLYCLGHMAINYWNLDNFEQAITLADSIQGQTILPYMLSYSAEIMIASLYRSDRSTEAAKYIDTLFKYSENAPLTSSKYVDIARTQIANGDISDAKIMLSRAISLASNPEDTLSYHMALLRFYEKINDIPNIYSTLDTLLILQNQVAKKIRKQSSVVAQRDFFSQQAKNAELKAQKRKYSIILIVIVSVSVIIIVILLFLNKIKRKDAEIRLKVAQIQYLTSSIDTNKNTMLQLSQSLLQKRLRQLNMLVNEFYESTDTPESRKAIYKNIEKEVIKLTDKSNISEIESIVNSCMDDIVEKMRSQLTDFSNDDITFLALTVAGYGAKAISLFTGIKPNSTYMKRTRLIDKIAKSDAPDKDWFISKITGTYQ